jgi:hypothetical protein
VPYRACARAIPELADGAGISILRLWPIKSASIKLEWPSAAVWRVSSGSSSVGHHAPPLTAALPFNSGGTSRAFRTIWPDGRKEPHEEPEGAA